MGKVGHRIYNPEMMRLTFLNDPKSQRKAGQRQYNFDENY